MREGFLVDEVGVSEMGVVVEVVVDGVVLAAAFVFASVAEVGAGNAEVVDEYGVVGAGAEGADAAVGARFGFGRGIRVCRGRRAARRARFQTDILVSGSSISFATLLMKLSSECEPPARKRPRPLPSELK